MKAEGVIESGIQNRILQSAAWQALCHAVMDERVDEVGPLPGSSRECLAVQLALSGQRVVCVVAEDTSIDAAGQNCMAYAALLGLQAPVIPYHFSGIHTERLDTYYLNAKYRGHQWLQSGDPGILIASMNGAREKLKWQSSESVLLRLGLEINREGWIHQLHGWGYERVRYIERPFEFAVRGGILDVYPVGREWPVRMEFFGDTIDLLRDFDPADQRTTRDVETVTVAPVLKSHQGGANLLDIKDSELRVLWWACPDSQEGAFSKSQHHRLLELLPLQVSDRGLKNYTTDFTAMKPSSSDGKQRINDTFDWLESTPDLGEIYFCCSTEGEEHRLKELVTSRFTPGLKQWSVFRAQLGTGFICEKEGWGLVCDDEIYNRYQTRSIGFRYNKGAYSQPVQEFDVGDYVVHFTHGVGRFQGIQQTDKDGLPAEVMVVEYADQAKLYVPREQYFLLEKYIGNKSVAPRFDRLGTTRFSRKKDEAAMAVQDYAARILKIEAAREMKQGSSYQTGNVTTHDFEHSFRFQETPDQEKAILQVKNDLGQAKPMNRLILGDVGFGKTEVAARAAFMAAMEGQQSAMLVPTTILAQQHYQTFCERMADFPVRIAVLSRFTSGKAVQQVLRELRMGSVDILIGTHRLLQKDVHFKNLGLLIIDEEQRFGVAHKDHYVRQNPLVNILTLSATPIPRTLYLSLMGARDMSAISTPPRERRPIETFVIPENYQKVREVIRAEVRRGGQVFFVHNRVQSIAGMCAKLAELVPEASLAVAHGQLSEKELKQVMESFQAGQIDCLLATSIIESGLDLPNVNTLIVHRADQFGLADLYQLRGRVGRYNRQAFAYFMLTPGRVLDSNVKRRVNAIYEFTKPGGGYRVALKDLEIRGAGNILGTTQSGHITAIGFDLYCKLLKDAIKALKGEPITPTYEVVLYLGETGSLAGSYVPDFRDRFQFYKRLAQAEELNEVEAVASELIDKFGRMPSSTQTLMEAFKLKCLCRQRSIVKMERGKNSIEIFQRGRMPRNIKFPQRLNASLLAWLIEWTQKNVARLY